MNAFIVVVVLVVVSIFGHGAYVVWYAKSGRYETNRRLDAVTKR